MPFMILDSSGGGVVAVETVKDISSKFILTFSLAQVIIKSLSRTYLEKKNVLVKE